MSQTLHQCQAELESVVATSAREPNSGLIVMPDAFAIGHHT
jgi:hypothetical protein